MFFLLRMAFWLSVVLVLLPSGGAKQAATAPGTEIGAADAVSAATKTIGDMRHFCTRQPDACAVGSQAAVAFGQRAQAGAKMVYDLISERGSERGAPRVTGSIADKASKPETSATKPARDMSAREKSAHDPAHDTLTAADTAPAWRGPRRDAHNKHGA
jgi:membrane-bound ClpP family serine protease